MIDKAKAIDRTAKLQAAMQSEQALGNETAALSFAAAVQRLMLEHELNDDDIVRHRATGTVVPEEPIIEDDVPLHRLGIDPSNRRNANLEALAGIVGRAHLCRFLIRSKSNRISFVGTARHVEVSQYMLTVMWRALHDLARQAKRQAAQSADAHALHHYTSSFKAGFLERLNDRYNDERRQVVQEVDDETAATAGDVAVSSSTALVRLDKAMTRVKSYMDSTYGGKRGKIRLARGLAGGNRSNARGYGDGQTAASRLGLRANGIAAGTARRQLTT